jgi:hypothetical protein
MYRESISSFHSKCTYRRTAFAVQIRQDTCVQERDMEKRLNNWSIAVSAWIAKNVQQQRPNPNIQSVLGIGTTFDQRKAIGEACLAYIAFYGSSWQSLVAVMTVTFATLRKAEQLVAHLGGQYRPRYYLGTAVMPVFR